MPGSTGTGTAPPAAFPAAGHDHQGCVAAILADAEAVCTARKVRLTAQRRRVLEIIAAGHGAIGAYDILARLAADGKRPAPVAVYRALEFLIGQGLVHRLASLNAYVACVRPARPHVSPSPAAQFLICSRCGAIGEIVDARVSRAIAVAASEADFAVAAPLVEVVGLCCHCRAGNAP